MDIRSWIGLHSWRYRGTIGGSYGRHRVCNWCDRRESASYDMGYGETVWTRVCG